MNDADLRERFNQWAAPLRAAPPPEFATIRRRARRKVAWRATAGGAALVTIGLVAGLVVSGPAGIARQAQASLWGSARYPAPPGQPYVVLNAQNGGSAEVRDVATGTVVSVLHPLGNAASFSAIAAAPGDRVFVLAEQGADGQVSFAELRIGSGSTPRVRLSPVLTRASLPAGTQVSFMAVNAAATRLAADAAAPGGANRLIIYNLRDGGVIGDWLAGNGVLTFPPQFLGASSDLVVDWPAAGEQHAAGRPSASIALRRVSATTAFPAGSSFLADSRPEPGVHGVSGTFTQDGSVSMNALDGALGLVQEAQGSGGATRLIEYSSASGKLLHVIPVGPASALHGQYFCGVLWASADGSDLLTQCGTRQQAVVDGKITAVRLPWIFPAQLEQAVSPFAW